MRGSWISFPFSDRESLDGTRGAASEAIKNVGEGDTRGRGEETQGKRRGDSARGEAQLGASRKS